MHRQVTAGNGSSERPPRKHDGRYSSLTGRKRHGSAVGEVMA
jgi:hypothetical protein